MPTRDLIAGLAAFGLVTVTGWAAAAWRRERWLRLQHRRHVAEARRHALQRSDLLRWTVDP